MVPAASSEVVGVQTEVVIAPAASGWVCGGTLSSAGELLSPPLLARGSGADSVHIVPRLPMSAVAPSCPPTPLPPLWSGAEVNPRTSEWSHPARVWPWAALLQVVPAWLGAPLL